ncbi:DoxX family protein [Euzebya tangerina]|uniref:DoxX family protein n=1 Tax=Euzebya tangerina TaxID=591198 RepID=UPI000E30D81B|nr:DoxX family protein [Euzebya tangerina]
MSALNAQLHRLSPAAPVIIRVTLGVIMFAHGWQKLTEMGPANFGNNMLAGLGFPAPVFFGWLGTGIELVGGALLIVGFLSRLSGIALTAFLATATLLVKVDIGFLSTAGANLPGAELDLALIALALGVVALGPGRFSVDHALGLETAAADAPTEVDLRDSGRVSQTA